MNEKEKYQYILRQLQVPEGKTTDEAWQDLSKEVEKVRSVTMVRRWWPYLAAAASLALLVGLIFWTSHTSDVFTAIALPGEHKQVLLPDGSMAELNAGSSLEWRSDREVVLSGEAFFNVKKGSRFVVNTSAGVVEVLGTSFNVRDFNGRLTVHCATGKVAVIAGNSRVELNPGQMAALNGEQLHVAQYATSAADWRADTYEFIDKPLVDVLEEIERQFNVRIEASGIESRMFTGVFTGKDLRTCLDQVCLPMALVYTIGDDMTITIAPVER